MGKSKSKSAQNTTNVSGQNAIQGDNLGVAISGINNSTVNATMTDHGAIKAATELAENSVESAFDFGESALGFGEAALDSNTDIAKTAMNKLSESNGENLQMLAGLAGNQAEQNTKNLSTMMELAKLQTDGGQTEVAGDMKTVAIVASIAGLAMMALFFMMRE
ncbi:chemotaxis protein [Photobacterium halotolerans]|uniref:chemotaxis protein n=1 Tax=Photobacterium halotolerans TaxID=265726 RepID=UPI0013728013|nr:chemotaxis protein [Photobacterium halotolerans]NAW87159.1 chemotaxis protein [Photobacterium halotolerans]